MRRHKEAHHSPKGDSAATVRFVDAVLCTRSFTSSPHLSDRHGWVYVYMRVCISLAQLRGSDDGQLLKDAGGAHHAVPHHKQEAQEERHHPPHRRWHVVLSPQQGHRHQIHADYVVCGVRVVANQRRKCECVCACATIAPTNCTDLRHVDCVSTIRNAEHPLQSLRKRHPPSTTVHELGSRACLESLSSSKLPC